MSFARGDLARRAALADNLAVPEPWGANDDPRALAAIRDLKDRFRRLGITDADGKGRLPDFLIDYENLPPIKPVALDRAHTRNSAAARWDQDGNLVEEPSDTLRLQRDPATQEVEGLLYEPQRTQILSSPMDIASANWTESEVSTTADVASAKGQNYDELTESSNDAPHDLDQSFTGQTEGNPFAVSCIVKANGRDFLDLAVQVTDDDNSLNEFQEAFFDIGNGAIGTTKGFTKASLVEQTIDDLGNGWYRCKFVVKPDSAWAPTELKLRLSNGDGVDTYSGDGTSGIFVMHAQAEVSREVTTPILNGNATRGADEVNYPFAFPDRTTGVAYSIEQQAGDNSSTEGFVRFGDTSASGDHVDHGVLMTHNGLDGNFWQGDGYQKVTRNTNDDSATGESPQNETITKFQVQQRNQVKQPIFIVRQIAIHTQPHTQAQKSALADQYLTQG